MSILRKCSVAALLAAVLGSVPAIEPVQASTDLSAPYNDEFGHYHTVFKKGPLIPNLDQKYVPQGISYWPSKNWILIAYYYHDKNSPTTVKDSIIAVIDRATGNHVKNIYLNDDKTSGAIHHAGHVGGLAVSSNYLWVSSTAKAADSSFNTFRYKLSDVAAAGNNSGLKLDKGYNLSSASYSYYADGDLWVGKFDDTAESTLYRYNLDSAENVLASPIDSYSTPQQVQGVAITDNYIIYSQSLGRNKPSYLRIYNKAKPSNLQDSMTIPNMSEGLMVINGSLYINFESGADYYSDGSYVKKTITYGKLGFIIPDYWKKIYGSEALYAPNEGYMRTWTESDASDDLRVELEGIKYSPGSASTIATSALLPSISMDGDDFLDNDSWNYTYTNFPNPEFDNFDQGGDGIDNDNVVQVTARGSVKANYSYRFGSSFEPQNTSQSGEIRFYSSMSDWNGKNMIPKQTDYLGKVPWKYGLNK
ncbi:hypothetical protein ACFPYJ_06660 [Paenibacillus solisilvae]|uniref:Uncharacterized protein n=1 Tax=Paenibacillus solisilvae TaxID=2486751 RepID=A0ABW0VV00_9BACL